MDATNHITDLLDSYALGILGESDTLLVAGHLAECESCRAELHNYQQVVDELALATRLRTPPAGLKTRLMQSVHTRPDTFRLGNPQVSTWKRMLAFIRQPLPAWGLAGLAVLIVFVVVGLGLTQRLRPAQPATDFRIVALASTTNASDASGVLVMDPNGKDGTLVVYGLTPLDTAHQYQLWLVQNGNRTSGGLFKVWKDGYGSMEVSAPQPLRNYEAFGITIEPAAGSPGPTGLKVLGSK